MVMGSLGTEGREVPTELVAVTVNLYFWPGVKPSTVQEFAGGATVQTLEGSSVATAVNEIMGDPPSPETCITPDGAM